MDAPSSERNLAARELFAPLAKTYDRYARLFSFGIAHLFKFRPARRLSFCELCFHFGAPLFPSEL